MGVTGHHNGNTDLARKYIEKFGKMENGKPTPMLKLAKILYNKEPIYFNSVESARKTLQYIYGKLGEKKRNGTHDKSLFEAENRTTENPYNLPEPESDDLIPFNLQWDDYLGIADLHIPNHRLQPIDMAVDYANREGIRKLLINGDLLDNTPFTRWLREPVSGQDVKRWFDQAITMLGELKKHFDQIIWLEGNHDFWYTRWLMSRVEILYGDPYYSLEKRLELERIGIDFLDQSNLIKSGKLFISHGHIIMKGGGKHAAANLITKSGVSHLIGHVHKTQTFPFTDLSGRVICGYTMGSMCTNSPEYQRYGGQSNNGFVHISVEPNMDFNLQNYMIVNGKLRNG